MAKGKKKELTPEEKLLEAKKASFDEGSKSGHAAGLVEGLAKGKTEGKKQGFDDGQKQGREEGYSRGNKDGYKSGKKEGYKDGVDCTRPRAHAEGRLEGKRDIVTSIEARMAGCAGFTNRDAWAQKGQIPAWWIGVLMENWEPSAFEPKPELQEAAERSE